MSYKVLARFATTATLLVLAACQTTTGGSSDGGKWKNLGASANQNVTHEIDTASIKRNGDMVAYRTRMVLKNAGMESTPNLPAFKTGINQYQCSAKTKPTALPILSCAMLLVRLCTNKRLARKCLCNASPQARLHKNNLIQCVLNLRGRV